jgi:hypothetical protein
MSRRDAPGSEDPDRSDAPDADEVEGADALDADEVEGSEVPGQVKPEAAELLPCTAVPPTLLFFQAWRTWAHSSDSVMSSLCLRHSFLCCTAADKSSGVIAAAFSLLFASDSLILWPRSAICCSSSSRASLAFLAAWVCLAC